MDVLRHKFVVYYDRCCPKSPLKEIMPILIPWAFHIFPGWEDDDYNLLSKVDGHRAQKHPGTKCFLVTIDAKDFLFNVSDHPAFNKSVRVEVFKFNNGRRRTHRDLAEEIAKFLICEYLKKLPV